MSSTDVEHALNMISGCESLSSGQYKEPNAVYAFTVLKLHAGDEGHIAGTESFMSAIKKGAKNVAAWILELIKSITSWIAAVTKRTKDFESEYKELKARYAKIESGKTDKPAKDDKSDKSDKPTDTPKEKHELKIKTDDYIPKMEKIVEKLEKLNGEKLDYIGYTVNANGIISGYKTAIKQAGDESTDIWALSNTVLDVIKKATAELSTANGKLSAWNRSMDPKELSQVRMGPVFNDSFSTLWEANDIAGKVAASIEARISKELDKWEA